MPKSFLQELTATESTLILPSCFTNFLILRKSRVRTLTFYFDLERPFRRYPYEQTSQQPLGLDAISSFDTHTPLDTARMSSTLARTCGNRSQLSE